MILSPPENPRTGSTALFWARTLRFIAVPEKSPAIQCVIEEAVMEGESPGDPASLSEERSRDRLDTFDNSK